MTYLHGLRHASTASSRTMDEYDDHGDLFRPITTSPYDLACPLFLFDERRALSDLPACDYSFGTFLSCKHTLGEQEEASKGTVHMHDDTSALGRRFCCGLLRPDTPFLVSLWLP